MDESREYLYMAGCDVGIRNLTICFARIPATPEGTSEILQKIEIDSMYLINLLEKDSQQVSIKPKCFEKSGKTPCRSLVRYVSYGDEIRYYCERHRDKILDKRTLWQYTDKPITKRNVRRKSVKRGKALTQVVDSDTEEGVLESKSVKELSKTGESYCGFCEKSMSGKQYHRWISYCIFDGDNFLGYRYLPFCVGCVRKGNIPEDAQLWPPTLGELVRTELKGELIGPSPTETEIIMDNLVEYLHDKFGSIELDLMFIENQPTMMNPRMKSIQMILYGFFQNKIRKERGGRCLFVSPNLKWKMNMPEIREDANYREHKKESVRTFIQWIDQHRLDQRRWLEYVLSEKKKDDLCDAFWLMISGMSNWKISKSPLVETNQERIENKDDDTK